MLALSPPFFSTFGWQFEDPISQEHNNIYREIETSDSLLHSPSSQPQVGFCDSTIFGDATVVKKLNHNASERDRRKRINNLYSSLFSLLPAADQTKKLSIPATVSRVVKYIPELQEEVEKLIQKKEELLSKISRQQDFVHLEKQRKGKIRSCLSFVTATPLGEREVMIHISTDKANKCLLSEALQNLEEDGLILLCASSFQSFGDRVFYNLHLQVQGNHEIEFEMLREQLLVLYEKREEMFL